MLPLLSDLLDDSCEPLAAVDIEGRVLCSSRMLRDAIGWSEDQVATANLVAAAAPEIRDDVRSLLARGCAGERGVRGPWTLITADGQRLEWTARLHRTRDPTLVWVSLQSDAARVHAQIGGLLDASPQVGLIATDLNGTIIRFNRGAERLYGLTAAEVLGQSYEVLPFDQEEIGARIRELARQLGRPVTGLELYTLPASEKGSDEISVTIPRADGTRCHAEVVISPIHEATGDIVGFVGILRDVTEARAAQAAHERVDQRLRGALLGSLDSIVLAEAVRDDAGKLLDLVIVDANPGTSRLMRLPRAQLIGAPISRLGRPDKMGAFFAKYDRVIATGETLDEEIMIAPVPLLPGVAWLRHQAVRVGDGVAITTRDITKRKLAEVRLRDSEGRLALALEASGDVLWDWDLDAGTVFFTRGHAGTTATYSEAELNAAVHPDDRAAFQEAVQEHMSGRTSAISCEYRVLTQRGDYRWVLGRGRVVAHDEAGRPLRLIGTQTDVSARRRQEDELRQAMHAAEAASRAKSEFLAHVSHEIRTPMNGILGMVELALLDDPAPSARDRLHVIQDSARSLLAIINDLLDVTKIEAGKLALTPVTFDLHAVLQRTVDVLRPRAEGQGLSFAAAVAADVPRWLVGDPDRLRQVLVNLIGNAIKFTPRGEVRVEVALIAASERARMRFSVHDTGIGIPPDRLAAIFVPFEQGDASTTRRFGGTGLGLTIADRLVRLMGGAIEVDSRVDHGSSFAFEIELPRAAPAPGAAGAAVRRVTTRPLRVLLAEDHPINQLVAAEMLRGAGHEVVVVQDGLAAVEAAASSRFDLVLMDVQMPDLDGWEAAAAIRRHPDPRVRSLPIVAMTARATESDRLHSIERGMDGFLTKPVQLADLQAALAEIDALRRPPTEPVVDWEAACQRVGGSRATLLRVIEMAREETPTLLHTIRSADSPDLDAMFKAAHRAAGTAALFGAAEVLAVSRELEARGPEVDERERGHLVARVVAALERFSDELAAQRVRMSQETG